MIFDDAKRKLIQENKDCLYPLPETGGYLFYLENEIIINVSRSKFPANRIAFVGTYQLPNDVDPNNLDAVDAEKAYFFMRSTYMTRNRTKEIETAKKMSSFKTILNKFHFSNVKTIGG